MKAVMVPVIVVNFLAGPVSFVWLVLLGQWWALGYGLLSLVASHFVLGIALLPGLALAAPAAIAAQHRSRFSATLGIPALLYIATLMTVWCMGVLTFFMERATDETWIPLALLAFGVGTGPWGYMAQQEARGGGGEGAAIATFFMNLAFVIVLCLLFIDRYRPVVHFWAAFGAIMAVQVGVAFSIARRLDTRELAR